MMKSLFLVVLSLCVISQVFTTFTPRPTPITLPAGTVEYDYSYDHSYLGILAPTQLKIYHTQTGLPLQSVTIANQSFSSFAFSLDNSLLAIASNDGKAYYYSMVDGQYVLQNNQYKHPTSTSKIQGICFSSDKKYVFLGLLTGGISAWNIATNTSVQDAFATNAVQTVTCSPVDPTLLVVGGGLAGNTKLTLYTYTADSFTVKNDIPTEPGLITDSTFTANGSKFYISTSTSAIKSYDSEGNNPSTITDDEITGKNLQKIRVSQNERLIATVYSDAPIKVVIITRITQSRIQLTQQQSLTGEPFDTNIQSVALSSKGSFLFYTNNAGAPVVSNQCLNNQTTDSAGLCTNCDPACQICDGAPNQCYLCQSKYFLNGLSCLGCGVGCLACTNETTCTSCDVGDAHFHDDGTGNCVCDNRYFLNTQTKTCDGCILGCQTCVDNQKCVDCRAGFILSPDQTKCTCAQGTYYDIAADDCKACIRGCQQCSDGTTCTTCDIIDHYITNSTDQTCVCNTAEFYIDDGTACVCKKGYFNNSVSCTACNLQCADCRSSTDCTECRGELLPVGGICQCQPGQWHDIVDFNCTNCNLTLKYCLKCDKADACLDCQDGLNRVLLNDKCVCKSGFYNDTNDVCLPCGITGCLQCTDSQTCTECDTDNNFQSDLQGKCVCKKKFVLNEVTQICDACSKGCNVCATVDECTECDIFENWVDDGNKGCICRDAFFESGQSCQPCMHGCLLCTQAASCTTCDTANHFKPDANNVCVCDSDTLYIDKNVCKYCSQAISHCSTCTDAYHCKQCVSPFLIKDNICKCADGQYQQANQCPQCPEGCSLCDNKDKCTQCKQGFDLDADVCKKSGIDTLVIVLIVVGVVVLAGAVFVIIKCIKKRKSPLSQDDYDTL